MEEKDMQEIQFLEQGLQNILFQKQAFQMELSEAKESLKELEKSGDDVFKVIGQIMIKADKANIKKEIESKVKIFELRLQNLEKQENSLSERIEKIREDSLKH